MTRTDLISEDYLESQIALHADPRGYGSKGSKWAAVVAEIARQLQCLSVLDYGCGRGSLAEALRAAPLGLEVREYDPAIKGKNALPDPADLVVCTDVLEHIEPDKLDAVIRHLGELASKAVFAVIATRPASKNLPDGRNAHLIIEDATWWTHRLFSAGFDIAPGPTSPLDKPSREVSLLLTKGPEW